MDPNANLACQERLLLAGKRRCAELRDLREALRGWLAQGGFEPSWAACPRAACYYNGRVKAFHPCTLGVIYSGTLKRCRGEKFLVNFSPISYRGEYSFWISGQDLILEGAAQ